MTDAAGRRGPQGPEDGDINLRKVS